jgi:ketosteroid isomerase-like protein
MADSAGTFLRGWFGRLAKTGWTAEVFLAALAEDLVWTATGTSPISGTYHGRDAYIDGIYHPCRGRPRCRSRGLLRHPEGDGAVHLTWSRRGTTAVAGLWCPLCALCR